MASVAKPSPSGCDVVIAGASFAGLAGAQRLAPALARPGVGIPSVLLIDKAPIGAGQTSACGAPVSIVRAMGAEASIQQVHDALIIHTPGREVVWPLPDPFCTFDYRRFCELAVAQTAAGFRQAEVIGRAGTTVRTAAGDVQGRYLIDATGWRALLAGGPVAPYVDRRWMAFGLETELPAADFPPGLHFYFLPEADDGYAWAFPCGETVRFGVLSYRGRTKLTGGLAAFLSRFGLRPGPLHGGYLASGLRPPVVDDVLVAGDASGQCLPLTGEGIRTAVLAGFKAGDVLRHVLDGSVAFADAAREYALFTRAAGRSFRMLTWGTIALLLMPQRLAGAAAAFLSRPRLLRIFLRSYLGVFSDVAPAAEAVPAR